jgi:hypothetical protein
MELTTCVGEAVNIEEMDNYFSPIVFSQINGYSRAIPEKAIGKLLSFQGNNAISAKSHLKSFLLCINKWCSVAEHNH